MIGRRTTIGLALLGAFAFCAFAAQSAMAQVGTHSTNTTAVTCVKVKPGTGDFEDPHCDILHPKLEGEYDHEAIAKDVTTEVEVTTEKTKNNTTEHTPAKLNGTLAGVNTEITCTTVKSVPEKSFLHNVETEKKHTVTGTAQVSFTECTVVKPGKCKIKEPITVTANAVGVEGLGPNKDTMGVEFVGEGAEKTFAELSFENKSAEEKCSLVNGGKAFQVRGSAISTPKVAPNSKHSGSTAVYEDANEMETLEIGLKKASLSATFTTSMAGGGNPISATTVT